MGIYNKTQKELAEMHRRLMHENLQRHEMTHFINMLSEENYVKAKKDVVTFLNHPDVMVRWNVLIALSAIWMEPKYAKYCLDLLNKKLPEVPANEEDDNYFIQLDACQDLKFEQDPALSCLGSLLKTHKDIHILKFLIDYVEDTSKQWSQRESAYSGILHFLDVPYSKRKLWFKNDEEIEQYIDWQLVKNLKKKYEGVNVEEDKHEPDNEEKKGTKRSKKELDEMYRKLINEAVEPDLMVHYIDVLAHENYVKAKKDIATFLHHVDVQVRRMALVALTLVWTEPKYKINCLEILKKKLPLLPLEKNPKYREIEDEISDIHCEQRAALAGLANILWIDKDVKILKFFIGYVEEKNLDWDDKMVAYNGILNFLDVPYRKRKLAFQNNKEMEEYIDRGLVEDLNTKYRMG